MNIHWKDWCSSWSSNTLATWWEELTHWERPWCWERLKAWAKGDDRGWDSCMASLTQWTWAWVSSMSWWWTGKSGVFQSMGSQIVGYHEWLKWSTFRGIYYSISYKFSLKWCRPICFSIVLCNAIPSSPLCIALWFILSSR